MEEIPDSRYHNGQKMAKMAVEFAKTFTSKVESEIIRKNKIKPLEWKRYIDDVFSLCDAGRDAKKKKKNQFISDANRHFLPIKFKTEISEVSLPGASFSNTAG